MSHPETLAFLGYGCLTAAGQGGAALHAGLLAGCDYSRPFDATSWPATPATPGRICTIADQEQSETTEQRLARQLLSSWSMASRMAGTEVAATADLGVIFASTKGCVEDSVWRPSAASRVDDTLTPVLRRFLREADLRPKRAVCLSNACSSALVALQLAGFWLRAKVVRQVLILSADCAGPFVLNGFAALKSLAADRVTPFAQGRQGIQIGEAAAALLIGGPDSDSLCEIEAIDTQAEGYALTRSAESGSTLTKVCKVVSHQHQPDLILAHGTGTIANDAMEDTAYRHLFGKRIPITCTKWSIGHTLGASGAVDLIAACEVLSSGQAFNIGNTDAVDPEFGANYLTRNSSWSGRAPRRCLVASVGFGGMHAAALVGRR